MLENRFLSNTAHIYILKRMHKQGKDNYIDFYTIIYSHKTILPLNKSRIRA